MINASSLSNIWPIVKLDEVVEFLDHLRKPVTANARIAGPYPYYGANGQQDSVHDYIFDDSLVLLAEDGGHFDDPVRPIAYQVDGKCWVNNHAHVLRPLRCVDIRYLCRHLEHYDVRSYIKGATRKKLNKSAAQDILISLPPIKEQKRIAAILDRADAIRRKRQQAIDLADQFLRSVFLDMFADIQSHYIPLEDAVEKFIDYRGKTPPKTDSGIPLVTAKIVKNGRIQKAFEFIDKAYYDGWMSRGLPKKGDLLFTTEAPLGEMALVNDPKIALAQRVLLIRPDCTRLNSTFLMHALKSQKVWDDILRRSTGSTVKGIRQKELRKVLVPVPDISLQDRFAKIVMVYEIARATRVNAGLVDESLFQSLTQQAFKGELTQNVV